MAEKNFAWRIYPPPNKGLEEVMTSEQAAVLMFYVAGRVAVAYRAMAPKGQTGVLGGSARVSIQKSTLAKSSGARWVGVVTVTAPYAVWNLTGAGGPYKHTRSTGRQPWYGPFKGSYTFKKIVKSGRVGNP